MSRTSNPCGRSQSLSTGCVVSVFALYREHVRGRFTSRGLVAGTWRVQILLFDEAADWAASGFAPLDRCDSGLMTWGAVRQR